MTAREKRAKRVRKAHERRLRLRWTRLYCRVYGAWRAGLKCCHVDGAGQCAALPTVGIYPDDGGDPYRASHACEAHVGALLYEGANRVTPIGAEISA